MAKTITTHVTLHVKDVKRSRPFKYDAFGGLISGRHVNIEVPPGKPVQFEDEDEADRILARFGGEAVDATPHAVTQSREDAEDEVDGTPAPKGGKKAPAAT